MKSFKEFINQSEGGKSGDGNSNKWAIAFIASEIAIVVLLIVSYFMTHNFWILAGAVAYFLFSCAVFLRLLDMRKGKKSVKEEIDEQKRK